MSNFKDITGESFGRLTVKNYDKDGKWKCLCSCGTIKIIRGCHLKSGATKSCGCLNSELVSERNKVHDKRYSKEYSVWCSMKQRCYDLNCESYSNYGGRGIVVSDEWKDNFMKFYEDMGKILSQQHSIERIDNSGGYSKENCKWATLDEQSKNKRIYKNNKTGIKGVYFEKLINKYRVTIGFGGKQLKLGAFTNIEDALDCRKAAELKYWSNLWWKL